MQPSIFVHFQKPPDSESVDFLKHKLDLKIHLTFGESIDNPESISILVDGYPNRELIASLPALKHLIIPWAGVAPDTVALVRDFPGISIHNLHHNALPVAEYAMALFLSAAKYIIPVDQALRNNDWQLRYSGAPTISISGKFALILGYGHIGKILAKILSGFDLNIMATRNNISRPMMDGAVTVFPSNSLHGLLSHTDFLFITLPLTSSTQGLIGEKEIALLSNQSIIVNIGRGEIIDESALFYALKSKKIFSAGIDVWYNYPENKAERDNTSPANFPFHILDNIVMSPHRAGSLNQRESEERRIEQLSFLLNQAANNQPMSNQIDLEKGY